MQMFFESTACLHQVFSGKDHVGAVLADVSQINNDLNGMRNCLWQTLSKLCNGRDGFARRSYRFFPTLFLSHDEVLAEALSLVS